MQVAWIETFLAIVERGGFCAAADVLFRSQSRVSAHVASLELALGARLIDRSQRPVALTPAGQAFLDYATSAKSSLDAGAAAVRAVKEGRVGRVRLGVHAGTGAPFLPSLLRNLSRDHPDLSVDIVEQPGPVLDRALVDGAVDVAIRPRLPRLLHGDVNCHPLWRERMVAVVPCRHPLARREGVRLADLVDEPLITSDEAVGMLRELALEPKVAFSTDHPMTLVACVVQGLGIGFTNELALQAVPSEGAVLIGFAHPVQRLVEVCWRGELVEHSTTHALLDAVLGTRVTAPATRPQAMTDAALPWPELRREAPAGEGRRELAGAGA